MSDNAELIEGYEQQIAALTARLARAEAALREIPGRLTPRKPDEQEDEYSYAYAVGWNDAIVYIEDMIDALDEAQP